MGVELPLRVVVTILECCVTFSGVKLSIRSFVLLLAPKSTLNNMAATDQKSSTLQALNHINKIDLTGLSSPRVSGTTISLT